MSIQDNGGPAFPVQRDDHYPHDSEAGRPKQGLSMRDYFAAKAMQSLVLRADDDEVWSGDAATDPDGTQMDIAIRAYILADAMLKARQS